MATTATRVLDNYIAGQWTPGDGRDRRARRDQPGDRRGPRPRPALGAADLDAAVAAARAALKPWRDVSTIARARKLFELRERLVARQEDMARSVTTEMGKTLVDARAEVARMIEMVECACAIPTTMQGRVLEDVSRNIDAETIRQPVGVCAAIVPFNFPAMVPFWFLPFAIACGNTFVLKPSEQVPLTQQIAFEELDALDLPPGVVNLVNGGRDVVEGILAHPGIDAVSFVGSAPVAKIVYEGAAQDRQARPGPRRGQEPHGRHARRGRRPDRDGIIGSAFGAAGQRCMAGSVVVTVGEAHERLMPALVEATEQLSRSATASTRRSTSAPSSRARRATASRAGSTARSRTARRSRSTGAGRPRTARRARRSWARRSSTTSRPTRRSSQEEVFGPVLTVVQADSLDEAIEIVNASRFGNGTSIFTENAAAVRRYRHEVEAGMIGVNIGVAAPVAFFPFSGWKDSFLGDLHAHGPDAVEFYTRKKTVTSRYFGSGQGHGSYFVEH